MNKTAFYFAYHNPKEALVIYREHYGEPGALDKEATEKLALDMKFLEKIWADPKYKKMLLGAGGAVAGGLGGYAMGGMKGALAGAGLGGLGGFYSPEMYKWINKLIAGKTKAPDANQQYGAFNPRQRPLDMLPNRQYKDEPSYQNRFRASTDGPIDFDIGEANFKPNPWELKKY